MRIFGLAAVFATALFTLPALAEESTDMVTLKPEQIGKIFCFSRVGNDEAVIEGILTQSLKAALNDAEQKNADWEAKNPGEAPPLDGIPWGAWPDYAADCNIGLVTLSRTDAKVEIKYGFPEDHAADYTDQLILKKIDLPDFGVGVWRIDNVAYATGSDLKAELLAAFAP